MTKFDPDSGRPRYQALLGRGRHRAHRAPATLLLPERHRAAPNNPFEIGGRNGYSVQQLSRLAPQQPRAGLGTLGPGSLAVHLPMGPAIRWQSGGGRRGQWIARRGQPRRMECLGPGCHRPSCSVVPSGRMEGWEEFMKMLFGAWVFAAPRAARF